MQRMREGERLGRSAHSSLSVLQALSAAAGVHWEKWRCSPLQTHEGRLECLQVKFIGAGHNIFFIILKK